MVEQKPEQLKSQLKANDPEGYSIRGSGALEATTKPLGFVKNTLGRHPWLQKPVAALSFLGIAGPLTLGAAGCGNEKRSTTSESLAARTSITQPTTSSENPTTSGSIPDISTTLEETTITREKILYSDLVQMKDMDIATLPKNLQDEITKKIKGNIDRVSLFEASDVGLIKKVSIYFIDLEKEHYVAFAKDNGYSVEGYSVSVKGKKEKAEIYLYYSSNKGQDFITVTLGGDFTKKEEETVEDYFKRALPLVGDKLYSEAAIKYNLEAAVGVSISSPYILDHVVSYTNEQQGAMNKTFDLLKPEQLYLEGFNVETDPSEEQYVMETLLEGLIRTDITMDDIKEFVKDIPEWNKDSDSSFTNPWVINQFPGAKYPINGWGIMGIDRDGVWQPGYIVGKLDSVVLIPDTPENPNPKKEFYMLYSIPGRANLYPTRTDFVDQDYNNMTSLDIIDPKNTVQSSLVGPKYRLLNLLENGLEFERFCNKGETLVSLINLNKSLTKAKLDPFGVLYVRRINVVSDNYDEKIAVIDEVVNK